MRKKPLTISMLVIIVGIAGGIYYDEYILSGFYYVEYLFGLPSEDELPNEILIINTEALEEVTIFLQKYPDARIQVDRSGQLTVDYRISTQLKDDNLFVDPYLRLRVSMNPKGEPRGMFIECYNSQGNNIIKDNIVNYLKTETCLELRE